MEGLVECPEPGGSPGKQECSKTRRPLWEEKVRAEKLGMPEGLGDPGGIPTWQEKSRTVASPIQLCSEYMLGVPWALWKQNTAASPSTVRTNAPKARLPCSTFQGSLGPLQVLGMR